jgi:hypothetical protein
LTGDRTRSAAVSSRCTCALARATAALLLLLLLLLAAPLSCTGPAPPSPSVGSWGAAAASLGSSTGAGPDRKAEMRAMAMGTLPSHAAAHASSAALLASAPPPAAADAAAGPSTAEARSAPQSVSAAGTCAPASLLPTDTSHGASPLLRGASRISPAYVSSSCTAAAASSCGTPWSGSRAASAAVSKPSSASPANLPGPHESVKIFSRHSDANRGHANAASRQVQQRHQRQAYHCSASTVMYSAA